MARLIGTAGHVDHGKTTLIRALTGIDADRLPEEKARGMTLDVGFAYIELPTFGRVSIVDVPGHEKFIHNMLVGALGIDVALLCVAADEGVMPQTREHVEILGLLPVQTMVVALTRADLADADTRALASEEVRELLAEGRFAGAKIIPVSATNGEGLDELLTALVEALSQAASVEGGPWYLPIDRVFAVKGHGVVVTGTLAQGVVRAGETAWIEPGHREVRVRSIHWHGDQVETSEKGKRTALNLGGVKLEDVHRGMAVGAPGALFESNCIDVELRWLVEPKHGQRVRVSLGADEVMGKAFLNEHDSTLVQVRLESPVAAALNQPVIVRRYSPMTLLGGGRVIVPLARPRRKGERFEPILAAASDEDAILQALGDSPDGLMTEEICRLLGRTPQALGSAFESLSKAGPGGPKVFGFGGRWLSAAGFREGSSRLLQALDQMHGAAPQAALHPREKVVAKSGLAWAGKPLDRILGRLAQDGAIIVEGSGIRSAAFRLQLSDKQRSFLDRVKAQLDAAGANVPAPAELARALVVPPQAVEEILRLGEEAKEVVRIEAGVYYTVGQIETFKVRLKALGRPFSAAEVRDAIGSSRKYVIPLLEHLDAIDFTLRQGDLRVVRS